MDTAGRGWALVECCRVIVQPVRWTSGGCGGRVTPPPLSKEKNEEEYLGLRTTTTDYLRTPDTSNWQNWHHHIDSNDGIDTTALLFGYIAI